MALYSGYGGQIDKNAVAINSLDIEYGRINDASYYLIRIPRYTIEGKRIRPKVGITAEGFDNVNLDDYSGTLPIVSTLTYAKRENTFFALNAGLFDTGTYIPQGITIINGVSITNGIMQDDMGVAISDDECYPLCIDANGDLSAPYERDLTLDDDAETGVVQAEASVMIADGVKYAVTGWGQFIENYAKAPATKYDEIRWSNKYIRQTIGQYMNGDYFVCTVDGNKGGQPNDHGVTYDELSTFLISKGVQFAYSLDGGGSCETVVGQRQINPLYEGAAGRAVPTVIYFTVDD